MKSKLLLISAFAGLVIFVGCQNEDDLQSVEKQVQIIEAPLNGEVIPGKYIVVLNDNAKKFALLNEASYSERIDEVKDFAETILATKSTSDFKVEHAFAQTVKGFSASMSEEDAIRLSKDDRVKYIEQDKYITLSARKVKPGTEDPGEEIPYGILRVGYGNGSGKTAWIIDSGIDLDHPDLNVDVARSKDFTGSRKGAEDENGHGTHCAGTVAAIDNEIGVVGVAAGAKVVAVRVLDRRGSGSNSGVIAGVDYVASAASAGDAANMSLGGGVSQALDDAVYSASQNGIYFSLAAGNESDDANNHSPARANGPNIWTISAMDSNDNFAYFSNYGNPPVDFCEPGVNIKSTYKGGAYTTMSGTSMAAPHMCGILLMTNGRPATSGYVNGDPDGNADKIGHL